MVLTRKAWTVGVLLAAMTATAAAQQPPGGAATPAAPAASAARDPATLLREASTFLAGQKQFTLTVSDMMDETSPDGQKIQRSKHSVLAVRRPDRLAARVRGDQRDFRFAFDGKTVTIVPAAGDQFVRLEAPATIDAMFDELANRYGLTMPSTDVLLADPADSLLKNVRSSRYVGTADVLGQPTHHLAFRQETVDWQIWIAAEGDPIPLKMVITYKDLPGDPQYVAFYHQWNFEPTLDEAAFKLDVPANARAIELQPIAPAGGQ